MEKESIRNLKILALTNRNSVSEQDLKILGIKYSLSDKEMEELMQYCNDNHIVVYDEVQRAAVYDRYNATHLARKTKPLTKEEKEHDRLASIVKSHIIHIAVVRARKRAKGRGWLCGTHVNSMGRLVENQVRRYFSNAELKFIIDHLEDFDTEKERFALRDQQNQEKCDVLNNKLNKLIPRLYISGSLSGYLDD